MSVRFSWSRPWRRATELVLVALFCVVASALPGRGEDAVLPFQLEVYVNGQATKLIVGFDDLGGGRFAAFADDIVDIGIVPPEGQRGRMLVPLSALGTYRYDEAKQQIFIDVAPQRLKPQFFDGRSTQQRSGPATAGHGAVLNYAVTANAAETMGSGIVSAAVASLDGRVFSPSGLFQFGAFATTAGGGAEQVVRLDTSWQTSNESTLTSWRFGDAIGGSLGWSRPIRFAGVQYQRNFGLRPDLITAPLPAFSATAAVPSTLEVYVDGVRSYTQEVNAGPFSITNLPILGNTGNARVVLRDATGRITEFSTPFVTAPTLLRKGMLDWSLEAGVPRQSFGARSFDYTLSPVASGSLRYGLGDALTLETHSEAGLGVVNTGFGGVFPIGPFIVNAAAIGSVRNADFGARAFAKAFATISGVSVSVSSTYDAGTYLDLAAASTIAAFTGPQFDLRTLLNRYSNVLSLTAPLALFDDKSTSTLGFSVLDGRTMLGDVRRMMTASFTQRVGASIDVSLTGTYEVTSRDMVLWLATSISFDDGQAAALSATRSNTRPVSISADYGQQNDNKTGGFGWRTSVTRGDGERFGAAASYTAAAARIEATAVETPTSRFANATVSGAVTVLGGHIQATRTVADSFAVVDVGYAGVPVLNQNNPIGTTDATGRILVPSLISHQNNKISIDPTTLPADVQPSRIDAQVVPMRGAGVGVDMRVRPAPSSAIVEFVMPDGSFVPTGAGGRVLPGGEEFVVGFDGQGFLSTLNAQNEVEIVLASGSCRAKFAFSAKPGQQVFVEKVVCQ